MQATMMRVGPDEAQKYIDVTPTHLNRPISRAAVEQYAADMRKGEWAQTGVPLIVNCDGTLIDGHHRCHAIIASGVTLDMPVIHGADRASVFGKIDQHRKRSASDLLGIIGAKNAHTAAAVTRQMVICDSGNSLGNNVRGITGHHILAYYQDHRPELDAAAAWAACRASACKIVGVTPAMIGAAYILFGRLDGPCRDAFLSKLLKGDQLTDESPIFRLRDRFIRNREAKVTRLSTRAKYALLFKAWNHYRIGNAVRQLVWRPESEPFPMPE